MKFLNRGSSTALIKIEERKALPPSKVLPPPVVEPKQHPWYVWHLRGECVVCDAWYEQREARRDAREERKFLKEMERESRPSRVGRFVLIVMEIFDL